MRFLLQPHTAPSYLALYTLVYPIRYLTAHPSNLDLIQTSSISLLLVSGLRVEYSTYLLLYVCFVGIATLDASNMLFLRTIRVELCRSLSKRSLLPRGWSRALSIFSVVVISCEYVKTYDWLRTLSTVRRSTARTMSNSKLNRSQLYRELAEIPVYTAAQFTKSSDAITSGLRSASSRRFTDVLV